MMMAPMVAASMLIWRQVRVVHISAARIIIIMACQSNEWTTRQPRDEAQASAVAGHDDDSYLPVSTEKQMTDQL
jgi:hypothetical protein